MSDDTERRKLKATGDESIEIVNSGAEDWIEPDPWPAVSARAKETEWQRRQRRDRERAEHVAEHGPACQICGNVPKRGLDQDHDHRTGKTRGWLCHRCNRALPSWVDVDWLLAAVVYLDRGRT